MCAVITMFLSKFCEKIFTWKKGKKEANMRIIFAFVSMRIFA